MRSWRFAVLASIGVGLLAAVALPAAALPKGWHKSLDDGLEASAKSGKPLLVVTAWKEKV